MEVRITQSIVLELLDLLQNSEIVNGQPATSGTTVTCNVDHSSSGGTFKNRIVLVYSTGQVLRLFDEVRFNQLFIICF